MTGAGGVYGAVVVPGETAHRLSAVENGEDNDTPTASYSTRSQRCWGL